VNSASRSPTPERGQVSTKPGQLQEVQILTFNLDRVYPARSEETDRSSWVALASQPSPDARQSWVHDTISDYFHYIFCYFLKNSGTIRSLGEDSRYNHVRRSSGSFDGLSLPCKVESVRALVSILVILSCLVSLVYESEVLCASTYASEVGSVLSHSDDNENRCPCSDEQSDCSRCGLGQCSHVVVSPVSSVSHQTSFAILGVMFERLPDVIYLSRLTPPPRA